MKPTQVIAAAPAMDGAGVRINRIAGRHRLMDPYLMIDEIRSDEAQDYMAGFPPHPHRGFETITYLLQGRMKHEDQLGNQRVMSDGGVQWMTTGRGIVHSEMPEASVGQFHGFQIWLNLPSEQKMMDPAYQDLDPAAIPQFESGDAQIKLIAGALVVGGERLSGGFSNGLRTEATLADVRLPAGSQLALSVGASRALMVYVYEGSDRFIPRGHLGVFDGGVAELTAQEDLRAVVLAGEPLEEPVVQHGPFVMNTGAEIQQALRDFATGALG